MEKIVLTKEEKELFKTIKKYSITLINPPVPRAAGGWVRDKLLNKESHDIDIALDTISGFDFAIGLTLFRNESINKIGVVKCNPDKSKHLETAVLKINNFFVDFVCLRTEEYSNTRIPKIDLGTPKEDALRRDLTINSLFYNILTEKIEDFTGNGIKDLQEKIIRTPIDPLQTFYDDPLRILRAFRFSCRFSFKIHKSIYKALEDKDLRIHLKEKVSNERIGVEIKKIIENENCYKVFSDFVKYSLVESIFKPEAEIKIQQLQPNFFSLKNYNPKLEIKNIYLILIFYSNLVVKRKKPEFVNTLICKEGLKYPNKFVTEIDEIEKGIKFLLNEEIKITKVNLIKLVRKIGACWKDSFYFAILHCKIKKVPFSNLISVYNSILENKLENVYEVVPSFKGNDVIKNMNVKKEKIKEAIEDGIIYKILNPQADKQEILIYLNELYKE